ncbi:MAG: ABC transporter permease [bacterium]
MTVASVCFDGYLTYGDKSFFEDGIIYADSVFFDFFSFPLKHGNPQTALSDPNSIVLTSDMAEKYFGQENPVGRSLQFNNETQLRVTGVLAPLPGNTHLRFDFLELLDIEQRLGKTFSESFATDRTQSVVINEMAAQLIGFDNPVGKKLRIDNLVDGEIVGVVHDFHFTSLHHEIQPLALFMTNVVENIYVKLKPGNIAETLATVSSVTALLSKDFVKLVLLANVIAWPVAWFAMHKWLQNFSYRIEISWWVFGLAGGLALAIALLTVSIQAVRAALANPVDSLKYE